MAEQLVDLSFAETEFYKLIKDAHQNPLLLQKFNELNTLFEQYSSEAAFEQYQDSHGRFSNQNIGDEATSNYRSFVKGNLIKNQKGRNVKMQIYHKTVEVVNLFLQRDDSIQYAIYFKRDGKVYRGLQGEISDKYLKGSKDNVALSSVQSFLNAMIKNDDSPVYDVSEHYNTFLKTFKDTYRGKRSIPNSKIKEGQIQEGFERHLQEMHSLVLAEGGTLPAGYDWTVTEAWNYWKASRYNQPWYTGGTVNNVQVKNLTGGKGFQLASLSSIQDLINFMRYLMNDNNSEESIRRKAKAAYQVFKNNSQEVVDSTTQQAVEEIVDEIMKRLKI